MEVPWQNSFCCDFPCVKQNIVIEPSTGGVGFSHLGCRVGNVEGLIQELEEPTSDDLFLGNLNTLAFALCLKGLVNIVVQHTNYICHVPNSR